MITQSNIANIIVDIPPHIGDKKTQIHVANITPNEPIKIISFFPNDSFDIIFILLNLFLSY